tara:strand:+ start:734 stop:964 length:231 start_codon:yes stop_codon:yes gene_type:complete
MTKKTEWRVETALVRSLEDILNGLAEDGYVVAWVASPSTESSDLWTVVAKRDNTSTRIDEFVEGIIEEDFVGGGTA